MGAFFGILCQMVDRSVWGEGEGLNFTVKNLMLFISVNTHINTHIMYLYLFRPLLIELKEKKNEGDSRANKRSLYTSASV